jgi:hypothetical protein
VGVTQIAMFSHQTRNECVFSPDRRYRYLLKRVVNPLGSKGVCLWVMANPSVADEEKLDRTLTRCARYALDWGYSEMRVVNVRAWVSTDPKGVPADPEAIGPENWSHIVHHATAAQLVVCGWGKLGGELGRKVLALLLECGARPHALRLNEDGSPEHPLYLPSLLKPFPMREEQARGE